MKIQIDPDRLFEQARTLVLQAAESRGMTGRSKRRMAARELARWIDEQTAPRGWFGRFWERVDRPIYQALAMAAIEGAYQALRRDGAV